MSSDAVNEVMDVEGGTAVGVRSSWQSLAAGGVGGVCAVLTGHPFDLVKVRCQSNQAKSTLDAVGKIVQEAAARSAAQGTGMFRSYLGGFYKGVVPPLLGVTPIFAVSFWGYDVGKKLVSRGQDPSKNLSNGQLAMAGFISAIPTTLVTAPTERIKVVLQTSKQRVSLFEATGKLLKEGGVRSLFKGSLATFARDGPGSALYFGSYELTKQFLNKQTSGGADGSLSIGNVCLAGGVAGMSMWLIVFPIDTIKTKLQSSSTKQSMVNVTKEIYRTRGGIKGFFPGLGPAMLRSFPANAATFAGVEFTHYLFTKY